MRPRTTWKDRLAMLGVTAVILVAFAGCMRLAGAVNPRNNEPCTIQDVNRGKDRCDPAYPLELPSGTD